MVQSLPSFFNPCLNVCSLSQALGDVYTEVLEAAHPFHRGPTDHKRSVGPLLSLPESTISSLVLLTFRERQLSWHHDVSLSTSSKNVVSTLLEIRPRTTVLSQDLRTWPVILSGPAAFLMFTRLVPSEPLPPTR